jgi:hypothetical protein
MHAQLSHDTVGISAGHSYRTSSPVTARPMIIRWISLVPSKMVKILAVRAADSLVRSPSASEYAFLT